MTNQEIKTVGQTIAQETQIGGNTAARVGGVVEGIGVALDNKDAANGYYQATINGGTITVNAPNYLLGTGGNLRIKMPSAGTTASTLTIGNANAVQLWYNGAAVSSDNTWDAGEIISVFYDGTRFMASNSQGGGGDAEKIKYDNSQSGLAATDVQGGIDEIQGNSTIIEVLDKESLTTGSYRLAYNTSRNLIIWYEAGGSHYYIPCSPGDIFRLTGNSNYPASYAFVTEHTVVNNATAYASSIYSGAAPALQTDEVIVIVAPSDAAGLVINKVAGSNDCSPSLIEKITYVKPKELPPRVDGLEEDTDAFKWVDVDTSEYVPRRVHCGTTWVNTYTSIFIPVAEGDVYRFVGQSERQGQVRFLSSDEYTIGEEPTTVLAYYPVPANTVVEAAVPSGAEYMLVLLYRVSDNLDFSLASISKKEPVQSFVDGVIETEESNAELREGFDYVWSNVAGTQMIFTNKGTYINSRGTVTSDSNNAYRVFRFPVTGGETVYITGYAGSPANNYSHALAVVHATAGRDDPAILDTDGAVRLDTIWKVQKTGQVFERFKIKIPSDANYLFVGGHSTSCPQPLVERRTLALSDNMMESLAELMGVRKKITVGAWNIGHWAEGNIGSMEEDTDGKVKIIRKMVNDGHPDILGLTEYSSSYDGKSSPSDMFRFYDAVTVVGTQTGYCWNAVANNLGVYNVTRNNFPCSSGLDTTGTNLDPTDYKYLQGFFKFGSTVVKFICAHFYFGGNNTPSAQEQQAQDILDACANDEYVIVVGDFNITGSGVDDLFINAGYTAANHENIGNLVTWVDDNGTGTRALDNIYVKGFRMSNIRVIPLYRSGSYDGHTCAVSDHQMIVCDLEMK